MGVESCRIQQVDAHLSLLHDDNMSYSGLIVDSSCVLTKEASLTGSLPSDDESVGGSSSRTDTTEYTSSPQYESLQNPPSNYWKTASFGHVGTPSFRLAFVNSQRNSHFNLVSPWHDIPLHGADGLFNCVCKTPSGTWLRFESARDEDLNPLRLCRPKSNGAESALRFADNCPWNLGMLPQTWSDPQQLEEEFDGVPYDDEPLEVVDIGGFTPRLTGDVYPVKPLGAFALVDGTTSRLSWKIVAIAADDPMAEMLSGVKDMEQRLPGCLELVREWLRDSCAVGEGTKGSHFLPNDRPADLHSAIRAVAETHAAWQLFADELDQQRGHAQAHALTLTLEQGDGRSHLRKALSEGDGSLLSLELGAGTLQAVGEELEAHWERRYGVRAGKDERGVPVSGSRNCASSAMYNRAWEGLGEEEGCTEKDGKRTGGAGKFWKRRGRGKSQDFGQLEKKYSGDVFGFLRGRGKEVNSGAAVKVKPVLAREGQGADRSRSSKSWGFRRAKSESVTREGYGKIFGKKIGDQRKGSNPRVVPEEGARGTERRARRASEGDGRSPRVPEMLTERKTETETGTETETETESGSDDGEAKAGTRDVGGFVGLKVKGLTGGDGVLEKKVPEADTVKAELLTSVDQVKEVLTEESASGSKAEAESQKSPEKPPEKEGQKLPENLETEKSQKSASGEVLSLNKQTESKLEAENILEAGPKASSVEEDLYPVISLPPKKQFDSENLFRSPKTSAKSAKSSKSAKSPAKSPSKPGLEGKRHRSVSAEDLFSGVVLSRQEASVHLLSHTRNSRTGSEGSLRFDVRTESEYEEEIPVAPAVNLLGDSGSTLLNIQSVLKVSGKVSGGKGKTRRVTWSEMVEVLIYIPDRYFMT